MANPQIENGYTAVANEILDNLYKLSLNGTELKVINCILQCAAEVYPNIVDELYCCIVIGMSYDKMNKKKFVALDRKDFYAYRKKTLAVFRAALQACNRYPF